MAGWPAEARAAARGAAEKFRPIFPTLSGVVLLVPPRPGRGAIVEIQFGRIEPFLRSIKRPSLARLCLRAF